MGELVTEIEYEGAVDGGSLNHSAIQVNLAFLLKKDEIFEA